MRGFYTELKQPHLLVWPAIAIGIENEFWVCVAWLNFEFGWRCGEVV